MKKILAAMLLILIVILAAGRRLSMVVFRKLETKSSFRNPRRSVWKSAYGICTKCLV